MQKNHIETIIDDAYQLYMPQVRSEITDLTKFVIENTPLKDDKPINILEIGTKFGGSFYIWNSINQDGMNISIDISDGGQHGGISEEEMDKRDLWFAERFNNCHFIRGDSHSFDTVKQVKSFNEGWSLRDSSTSYSFIDFFFIDGDHSYEGVEQDFDMYSPFVKKGGIIAFHDIVISDRHHERNVYVGEFWKELTSNVIEDGICYNGQLFAFKELIGSEDQNWAGIGILIKL